MSATRPKSPRGFSLIELGIVIAVIAVLSSVVLMGSGYMNAAKIRNATELVQTLRQSARQFAQRQNNGVSYCQGAAANCLSMKQLIAMGLVSSSLRTPWGGSVNLLPESGVDPKCLNNACVKVCLETPSESGCTTCQDIGKAFEGNSIQVRCGGGCNLGGTCVLSLVSR